MLGGCGREGGSLQLGERCLPVSFSSFILQVIYEIKMEVKMEGSFNQNVVFSGSTLIPLAYTRERPSISGSS